MQPVHATLKMHLVLFRSLLARQGCISKHFENFVRSPGRACYDGVQLSLADIEADPVVIDLCSHEGLRLVCQMEPSDQTDAGRQLDWLSTRLAAARSVSLDLVLMDAPPALDSVSETTSYLYNVLPLAAQFLEAHPAVGRSCGLRNAHGKPLDTHVVGVCQKLTGSLSFVAEVVDVLPPTRLTLDGNESIDGSDISGKDDSISLVLDSCDHLYLN